MTIDFADYFWGDKHMGYHILYQNMKGGHDSFHELANFIKDRTCAEEENAKQMTKLSAKLGNLHTNNGTGLWAGWDLARTTLDDCAGQQWQLVRNLQELYREVGKYVDELQKDRKRVKQLEAYDAVNLMQTTTTCVQKAKETYISRCAELEKLKRDNASTKEIGKAEGKQTKAREEYRQTVDKYGRVRDSFVQEMVKATGTFQASCRTHVTVVRKLWLDYARHWQTAHENWHQICSQFARTLEQCDVEEMLSRFAKDNSTGMDKPEVLVFQEPDPTALLSHDDLLECRPLSPSNDTSLSLGNNTSRQKLALWLPGRRKNHSLSSLPASAAAALPVVRPTLGGDPGFLKKRARRLKKRSKDGRQDISSETNLKTEFQIDESQSTTSSKSDECLTHNGSCAINNKQCETAKPPSSVVSTSTNNDLLVDDQGYSIRPIEPDTVLKQCSSSDSDDELESVRRAQLKRLTIGPDKYVHSIDDLVATVGRMTCTTTSLRPSLTGDRTSMTGVPSRARPRSNTPTAMFHLHSKIGSSAAESTSFYRTLSTESMGSLSAGVLHGSVSNLNEVIPIAVAVCEYSHAWFMGGDLSRVRVRALGSIMVSFPAGAVSIMSDPEHQLEPLTFSLVNAFRVRTLIPNKQVLSSETESRAHSHQLIFDRLGLATHLKKEKTLKPFAPFYNIEVLRYEVDNAGAPLLLNSYWKSHSEHADLRVDYRLNVDECSLESPLLNIQFDTVVDGQVVGMVARPEATTDTSSSVVWKLTELSRHGDACGSLKARLSLINGPSRARPTMVSFQIADCTLSGLGVSLQSDRYRLSLLRRKVLSGKYLVEPEMR